MIWILELPELFNLIRIWLKQATSQYYYYQPLNYRLCLMFANTGEPSIVINLIPVRPPLRLQVGEIT